MSQILLLLDQKENRRLLAEWLALQHEVIADHSDAALRGFFDLCIVDARALDRLQTLIEARKATEQPVFLPILLVASRPSIGVVTRHLWRSVDESISSPIEKAELLARVEILLRIRRLSRENLSLLHQLEAELQRAAQVQIDLLPVEMPKLEGFEFAARSVPAREVGGDFFDWQQVCPDSLTFTVGDAMGRGMSAALLMATVRAALRTVTSRHRPAAALQLVQAALQSDLVHTSSFITLFHARLDLPTKTLRFVDAGHAHLFVRHPDGSTLDLEPRFHALGIPSLKPFQEGTYTFQPGDALVIYTDGLIDVEPDLGLDHQALAKRLAPCSSPREMVELLLALATSEAPQPDDATAAVLLCNP